MDESRVLIIGSNGQLGKALRAKYPDAVFAGRENFDITDRRTVETYDWSPVDIILNAAAYTDVDGAETAEGREQAWQINAIGPTYLAQAAKHHHLTLVHISTDYVFDGTNAPHTESEPYTPLGSYGQSKAAGDIAVSNTTHYYILRTSWLIGEGPNFVRTMIGLAEKNVAPAVVADQVGRPTFTATLVSAIDHLLRTKPPFGIYNISNDGEPTHWADVARIVFCELGRADLSVTETTTALYSASKTGVAPRPLQSTLDLRKIKATGFQPPDWRIELRTYVQNELTKSEEVNI